MVPNITIITYTSLSRPSHCMAIDDLTIYSAIFCAALLVISSYISIKKPSPRVFLLDFACYKPSRTLMCSQEMAVDQIRLMGNDCKETLFAVKTGMSQAGIGDSTYVPEALLSVPPNPSMAAGREEAEMVVFGAIDELLAKTTVMKSIHEIGILIVNCSLFNVVPSLSSMIVHRYKLRQDIASYNLTGMGCSAGLIAIGLAKNLLQVKHGQCALVVTTEIITQYCYTGKDRSKCASNCVFRLGGAAILLSNHQSHSISSKYELIHTVHVNSASSDASYYCIFQEEDKDGLLGISITKDLLVEARNAIELNLSALGPLILPLTEKIKFLKNLFIRRLFQGGKMPRYTPKFSRCIDRFFPHVGGKPVLDALQQNLGFDDDVMEAARMSLHRFGNTSSSSIWYELAYDEAKGRIKNGDRLWQIAYGSGFKCSSAIWRARRTICNDELNPWKGETDEYPINLDNIGTLDPKLFYFENSTYNRG